jgi:ribonucleotide reductase alpha subunit
VAINGDIIQGHLCADRDFEYGFLGISKLINSYLLTDTQTHALRETPQFASMRESLGMHWNDLDAAFETYKLLSTKVLSNASPIRFHSGTAHFHGASCYLLTLPGGGDSLHDIFQNYHRIAMLSQCTGGIGQSISTVRAEGALIRSSRGRTKGIGPMLSVTNSVSKYANQGALRKGAIASYLEPWHGDVEWFLESKLPSGNRDERTHDLHTALWIPDLFMERVENDQPWTLMCPHMCPGLVDVDNEAFRQLYEKYEREGRGTKTIQARDLFKKIVASLSQVGEPYICFKDTVNRRSNQKELGTIRSSNLCVTWDTELLTKEYGPIRIGNLVADADMAANESDNTRQSVEHSIEDIKENIDMVTKEVEGMKDNKVCDLEKEADATAALRALNEQLDEKQSLLAQLPMPHQKPTKSKEVHVWSGRGWRHVTPTKTRDTHMEFVRITTSHGAMVTCTHDHEWILDHNGERRRAIDLQVGDKLKYTSPLSHVPTEPEKVSEEDAYTMGAVYGYLMQVKGRDFLDGLSRTFPIKAFPLRKEAVTERALSFLRYNESTMRKHKDWTFIDHDKIAVIEVPKHLQVPRTLINATQKRRERWCSGFISGIGGQDSFFVARSCHSMTWPVFNMFRSVGEHVKMIPVDRTMWMIGPILKDDEGMPDDLPTVTGVQRMNMAEATYCVTVPKEHAVVFNQQLMGNCTEIVQFSSNEEIATCQLNAVDVAAFVRGDTVESYDWDGLEAATRVAVRNLNVVIDRQEYALADAKRSALRHRAIGIGVMGLADAFQKLNLPWEDPDRPLEPHPTTRMLNSKIHECMYRAALRESAVLGKRDGSYASFQGSPVSKGILQFDMAKSFVGTPRLYFDDWEETRRMAMEAQRNSELLAPMPTATTALIAGCSEGRDMHQANLIKRTILDGEYVCINPILIATLKRRGLWNVELQQKLLANNGSVLGIGLPTDVENVFKTAWEVPQRVVLDLASDAQRHVTQAMSTNIHLQVPKPSLIKNVIFYAWKHELKTLYYFRSRPAVDADQVAVNPSKADPTCRRDDPECEACSV